MSRFKGLCLGAVMVLVTISVTVFAHSRLLRWAEIRLAITSVSIGMSLMDASIPFDDVLREKAGIHPALQTREDAILYFILRGLDLDSGKYSNANYALGRYFLDKDCPTAIFYFREHCRTRECDSDTLAIIETAENLGCSHVLSGPIQVGSPPSIGNPSVSRNS